MKFVLFFLSFLIFTTLYAQEKPRPIVSVELEWEAVEGAKGYEIHISSTDFEKKFQSKTPVFHVQIPLGANKARGRSYDYRGVYGEWSDFVEFDALPQKVDLKSSHELFQPIVKLTGYKGWVQIKWKNVPGAKGYRFYLKDDTGKILASKDTKDAITSFSVRPGKYTYNITALYSGGIESDMSEFQPSFEVSGKKLPPPSFLSTEKDHRLKNYKLKTPDPSLKIIAAIEYSPYLGDDWMIETEEKIKNSYSATHFAKPGRYRISFRTALTGFADSDPIYQEFQIKPTPEMVGESR